MDGAVTAIEFQGIVRNRTKIGVEDGQAEDLINLRFVNGSWRTSGDGRHVYAMTDNYNNISYTQIFVHTNVYRHLLGVNPADNKLYWFASIDTDNVTIRPLTTENSSSSDDFIKTLPNAPQVLTTVTGDIWITQTGHLLTVIDEADDFEYFVFKTSTKEYIEVNMDVNGKATDRSLYPFGQVHFNCYSPQDDEHKATIQADMSFNWIYEGAIEYFINELHKKNQFSQPFLALVALKTYDGSFIYASNPVLLFPREGLVSTHGNSKIWFTRKTDIPGGITEFSENESLLIDRQNIIEIPEGSSITVAGVTYSGPFSYVSIDTVLDNNHKIIGTSQNARLLENVTPFLTQYLAEISTNDSIQRTCAYGSDLVVSIDSKFQSFLLKNQDIFTSFCIFVTKECSIFPHIEIKRNGSSLSYKPALSNFEVIEQIDRIMMTIDNGSNIYERMYDIGGYYTPLILRKNEDIIYELLHSPFYLLREYDKHNIHTLVTNPVVNLSEPEYEGLLENNNIVQQDRFTTEAFSRTTYLPKVSYMYNGRLHITNYKSQQFHGYPIDLFLRNNHSVKPQTGSSFLGLPNLAINNDEYLQHSRNIYSYLPTIDVQQDNDNINTNLLQQLKVNGYGALAWAAVDIETSEGLQRVVRYIPTGNFANKTDYNRTFDNFFEDLGPLVTFPDIRAKSIKFFFIDSYTDNDDVYIRFSESDDLPLKSHPLYNFAYYITDNLKPISITGHLFNSVSTFIAGYGNHWAYEIDWGELGVKPPILPLEKNTDEYFPNGLKVSETNQPMYFPVENTYQVGSGEILALCVNTQALGTGQTGTAPLLVFCTDGIYAILVDTSGEMAYTNTRPIGDDVVNSPRSVTRTDLGVVFSTDRGLMVAEYNGQNFQIREIGEPAEGDALQYACSGNTDYMQMIAGAMEHVADLPNTLCDTTDFLTYLKGAIINYNHNERELMVSNPDKDYSYIMDRDGNWSRRDYSADEYIQNYPTSYRLKDGEFYKVDEEGDNSTPLEKKKESDNKFFYLSQPIKLGSIGFKQAYRFAVRGYFNVLSGCYIGCYIMGSYDGRKWALLGGNEKSGTFTDIGCKIERTDVRFYRICLAGQLAGDSRIDYIEISSMPSVLNTKIR